MKGNLFGFACFLLWSLSTSTQEGLVDFVTLFAGLLFWKFRVMCSTKHLQNRKQRIKFVVRVLRKFLA